MSAKHEFKTPADLHLEGAKAAAAIVSNALVATWCNCDKETRGLVKIIIAHAGAGITVHGFGACVPTPCDWGAIPGMAYAANVSSSEAVAFSAQYNFSFKETIVVGHLDEGSLIVETFDHFTDGSGRSNYYSRYYMCKCSKQD